jgi:hypothetical protein
VTRPLAALALALLLAAPAAADPVAENLRAKVRAAVGYEAFRKLEYGILLQGKSVTSGVPGTFALRLHPDGRFAELSTAKTGLSVGFDGKEYWSKSFLNRAGPENLARADQYRFRYGLLGHRWLAPDAGFTVALDPAEHRPYRPVLRVRHPAAKAGGARVYIDPDTGLPTRFSVVDASATMEIEVFDWRDVAGAKMPERVTINTAVDGPSLTAETLSPATRPAGSDPFAPPPDPDDTRFDPGARPQAEARVEKTVFLVRPTVGGKPGPWLAIDTASPYTYFTRAAADRLALPAVGLYRERSPHTQGYRFRPAARFALGPAEIRELLAPDLPPSESPVPEGELKAEVGGLLGGDVLSRVVAELDWGAGTFAVHDPRAYRAPPGVVWEPVRFHNGRPYIEGQFEGKHTGLFEVCTMGSRVSINSRAVSGLNLMAGRPAELGKIGPSLVYRGTGAEFRVFGRGFRSVETVFEVSELDVEMHPYSLGGFGPSVLGPGTLVLDYPNRRIGFVPKR